MLDSQLMERCQIKNKQVILLCLNKARAARCFFDHTDVCLSSACHMYKCPVCGFAE